MYSKKYGNKLILDSQEQLKRSRFLQQRGFPNELVCRLFKQQKIT
ncbi:hypothetical protein BMETH_597_1 [methanotrophic bacterial endosymbiont of Bathymodiolus sp.]|nr:hypothetical protein BMETH_597_1 [methanotrophic bacterial endosymbiont of Bathymodiolus sp.]